MNRSIGKINRQAITEIMAKELENQLGLTPGSLGMSIGSKPTIEEWQVLMLEKVLAESIDPLNLKLAELNIMKEALKNNEKQLNELPAKIAQLKQVISDAEDNLFAIELIHGEDDAKGL